MEKNVGEEREAKEKISNKWQPISISLQNYSRNKLHPLRIFTTIFYYNAATTKGNFIHIIKNSVLVPI